MVAGEPMAEGAVGSQGGKNITLAGVPRPAHVNAISNGTAGQTISVGLEQRGAGTGSRSATSSVPLSTATSTAQDGYWLGLGADCAIPCFKDADCAAFYGSAYVNMYGLYCV